MAGLYRRATAPNFTSPAMQVAASRGAGGAIPGGGVSVPRGQQDTGIDMGKLGGLLGMLQGKDNKPDEAAAQGVHADSGAMASTLPSPAQAAGVGNPQAGTLGNGIPGTGGIPGGAGGMSNPMTGGMLDPQMLQNIRFFPGF